MQPSGMSKWDLCNFQWSSYKPNQSSPTSLGNTTTGLYKNRKTRINIKLPSKVTQGIRQLLITFPLKVYKCLPAEPNDKWHLLSGLNFTQHTLALASKQATECSMSVDHNLTVERIKRKVTNNGKTAMTGILSKKMKSAMGQAPNTVENITGSGASLGALLFSLRRNTTQSQGYSHCSDKN